MFIQANAMTSDFLSSISPGWVLMFLKSHRMVFTFLSWLDLLGFALVYRILQITIKLLTHGYRYHKLRKTLEKFFRLTLTFYLNLVKYRFKEYVSEGISHPVFYGDLVYKLKRVKCEPNFVSLGSKIVKRLRRRKNDQLIIERTICLVLGPSTALYTSFLKHCTLTNKAVQTIWRDLSKPPQWRQGPDPRPLWLSVGTLVGC